MWKAGRYGPHNRNVRGASILSHMATQSVRKSKNRKTHGDLSLLTATRMRARQAGIISRTLWVSEEISSAIDKLLAEHNWHAGSAKAALESLERMNAAQRMRECKPEEIAIPAVAPDRCGKTEVENLDSNALQTEFWPTTKQEDGTDNGGAA